MATRDQPIAIEVSPALTSATLFAPSTAIITSIVTPTPTAPGEIVTPSVIVVTVVSFSTRQSTSALSFSTRQSTSALSTSREPLVTAPSTPSSNPGLNTGAKAGIAIGAILGALFLAVAAFLLGKHFSHKRPRVDARGDELHGCKAELDGRPVSKRWRKSIRGRMNNEIHELPTLEVRAELDGRPLGKEDDVEWVDSRHISR